MVELESVLATLEGKPIFFEPAGGNHGDTLILMGAQRTFDRLRLRLTRDPQHAAAIIINGGGGLGVDVWSGALDGLRRFSQTFREHPLIILPSSFHFPANQVADCLVNRRAPAYLFARERYSLARLAAQQYMSEVQIGIAEDMAFALRGSEFLQRLRARNAAHDAARQILIVERFDREVSDAPLFANAPEAPRTTNGNKIGAPGISTPAAFIPSLKATPTFKTLAPGPVQRLLKKVVHRQRVAASTFTATVLARLYAQAPQYRGLPVRSEDVSSNVGFTFEQFLDAVVNAAVVITTRLHAGILAALLDKPTYLVSGRSVYPKLKSVYEYSMADMPHVHLW